MSDQSVIYKFHLNNYSNPIYKAQDPANFFVIRMSDYFRNFFYRHLKNYPKEPIYPQYQINQIEKEPIYGFNWEVRKRENLDKIEKVKKLYYSERAEWVKEEEEWKKWAITDHEIRSIIKENVELRIKGIIDHFRSSFIGEVKNNEVLYIELFSSYESIWEGVYLQKESLESLLIYEKMHNMFINDEVYSNHLENEGYNNSYKAEQRRNEERNQERRDVEQSYREGGGGDEWSDPSEFW